MAHTRALICNRAYERKFNAKSHNNTCVILMKMTKYVRRKIVINAE